ncbi:EAL domain-containing protein [Oscillatoria sp. FACHB-1407]|uniref:EAL domain-containing protein n=1 Tax=Oscillatoria sp. FACHB-1407 TaxID=2692847 RepID=UPI0016880A90|nr:EAL domain-containing protein [Oscillatoria sp. FACHB-1407]MBD2464714.1 EAL domain-containing protein [Oscillatoria sp. FACHB-1407]
MSYYPIRVLVIEDDEDDFIITQGLFAEIQHSRFSLDWVNTDDAALEIILKNQHDVYLVDYRLGSTTGLELIQTAIASGCKAPMILVTGQGDLDVDIAAMKVGVADYLVKGKFDALLLERSIRYAIERARTLEELRQALRDNDQLALAIENVTTGVVITAPQLPDNPVIFVNPAFTAITGFTPEDIMGENCRMLQGPGTDATVIEEIRQAIAARQPISCTLLNYRKDGTPFWNDLQINPVFDAQGKLTSFIGLQNDVTARKQAEEALERLRHLHELILNSAGEGIYGIDLHGNGIFLNPAAARMLGWEVDELIGKPIDAILHHANPELPPPEAACLIETTLRDGIVHHVDNDVFWRKDGTCFSVEYISNPIWEDGQLMGTVVTFRDVTERKRSEEALRESEERYALAVQGANDGIWDWNLKTGDFYFSPRWKAMLGYGEDEIGANQFEWFNRIHPEDRHRVEREITAHLDGLTPHFENEHRMCHRDGTYRWMLSRGLAVRDAENNVTRLAGSQTDITAHKQAEQRLLHNALYDTLTDLPNRALLMERLHYVVQWAQRHQNYSFAVLFLDLDRFKVVNDSLGHMMGDRLLIAIARRLSNCLRPGDTIARLGGDEFVILLEGIQDSKDVTSVADRIQNELSQPFNLDGHEIYTSASIGIALSGNEYDSAVNVLRDADTAMYRAKALGKSRYEIFDRGMHVSAVALLQLETDLRRAIDRKELQIYYQPIVSLKHSRLDGFEALLRWCHPERGIVSPAEFIPIAEETGLILPIGLWVLQEACAQMRAWHLQFPDRLPLTVSVNLSGKQFTPELITHIKHILRQTQLSAKYLRLEITESVLMENTDSAAMMLSELQAMGIRLSMDDFGTGYSSLSYLHRFPIDTLKIDRSFISKIDHDGEQLAIVRTIMTLAWNLGMDVIAEGVETLMQVAQLRSLKCEYGQGYFFSKPLDIQAVERLIAKELTWEPPRNVVSLQ